ncbi:BglG family transcription antiterminator [Fervidibacillus albus]|uniref:HTH domain-containing protein n=1 Tax=Fervidibacillus albus TaxID=2980026 RepID=A0A9E8LTL8_9BACI|nr:HTH domain-containing protein [Fervidibacillus albus]WAA08966.1 HTH domain-containing protein [Fervidibacillus albus]
MYFRAREREILELLLHENRFITTQDIAKHLQVSARTILRELKNMDTILNKYALNIERKTSKGIRITGEKQKKRALLKDLKSTGFNDLSQNERKLRILHSLIHTDEPLKLFTLAEQLNVTTATISNDLDQMENLLASFDLTLVRKRGYGVELIGSEYGKRSILGSMILENLDEVKFLETMENPDDCSELFDILDENKIKTVERVLKKIQPTLLRSIAEFTHNRYNTKI